MEDERSRAPKRLRLERWAAVPPTPSTSAMEERIEAVWTLTLACLAWRPDGEREPRLDRSVARVIRPRSQTARE